jgi:hypothetical protein
VVIREATVQDFEQLSEEEPLKSLRQKLLELSVKNEWNMVLSGCRFITSSFACSTLPLELKSSP